jgi:hypothetical protein
MKDRLKDIRYLIYLKSELIKQTKKEIKELQQEANMIIGYKKIEKQKQKIKKESKYV